MQIRKENPISIAFGIEGNSAMDRGYGFRRVLLVTGH
jgi:hypothetical protein